MAQATYRATTAAKGQPSARRYQIFRDQHDRKWGAFIEIKTGDPTCSIDALGWTAPLMPPQKYIETVRDRESGLAEAGRLVVNYAAWIRDLRQGEADYYERLHFFATSLYGERAGEMTKNPPAELRRYLRGEPPEWQPVYAAMKGDPWVLGQDEVKPAWAERYFRPKAIIGGMDLGLDLDPDVAAELESRFAELTAKAPRRPVSDVDMQAAMEEAQRDLSMGLRPGRDNLPPPSAGKGKG